MSDLRLRASARQRYRNERRIYIQKLGRNVTLHIAEASVSETREALSLVSKVHYQSGNPRGRILIARFVDDVALALRGRSDKPLSGDPYLAGVAILGKGCTRGKPVGRRDLAKRHFPELDLDKMFRDTTVRRMGLMMIQRVAVDPAFQGIGIGKILALECKAFATYVNPSARFVEVMTTRPIDDAKALLKGPQRRDFLVRAGFVLVDGYTGGRWRQLKGRKLEYVVNLYYWAPIAEEQTHR